jgi:hypothetical protein
MTKQEFIQTYAPAIHNKKLDFEAELDDIIEAAVVQEEEVIRRQVIADLRIKLDDLL